MRQAQFTLPKAEGDDSAPEFIVYYFQGGGGPVDENMSRWASQFSFDDGRDPMEVASIDKETLGEFVCHSFDLTGHYVG